MNDQEKNATDPETPGMASNSGSTDPETPGEQDTVAFAEATDPETPGVKATDPETPGN